MSLEKAPHSLTDKMLLFLLLSVVVISSVVSIIVTSLMLPRDNGPQIAVSNYTGVSREVLGGSEEDIAEAYAEMRALIDSLGARGVIVLDEKSVMRAPDAYRIPITPAIKKIVDRIHQRSGSSDQ